MGGVEGFSAWGHMWGIHRRLPGGLVAAATAGGVCWCTAAVGTLGACHPVVEVQVVQVVGAYGFEVVGWGAVGVY